MKATKIQFYIYSVSRSAPLLDEIPPRLHHLRDSQKSDGTNVLDVDAVKYRVSKYESANYVAVAISSHTDYVKSKKGMKAAVQAVLSAAPLIDTLHLRAEERSRRLIHNLKSLTAKSTQEIFNVIQQSKLIELNGVQSVSYISDEIKERPEEAGKAILEILKYQSAQKAEYSAFEKISGKISEKQIDTHDIHRVLMNVFYLFFPDFVEKKVRANVGRTKLQGEFDYDSIHACIYYIVDNSVKYTRRNSALNVTTSLDDGYIVIRFDMESLVINGDEQEKIFQEGYSGKNAVESKKNGEGIGLFLARAMADLNHGALNVIAGRPVRSDIYARNSFILSVPRH